MDPSSPAELFHNRVGVAEARGSDHCEGQIGLAPKSASKQSHGHLHRQHIKPLSAYRPHLLQHSLLLGKSPGARKGKKHTLKGNGARLT